MIKSGIVYNISRQFIKYLLAAGGRKITLTVTLQQAAIVGRECRIAMWMPSSNSWISIITCRESERSQFTAPLSSFNVFWNKQPNNIMNIVNSEY